MVCTAHQNCLGDQTEKNEMGGACSIASMGDRRGAYRVLVGKPRERDHLEDLGVDGRIKLIWVFRKWDGRHRLD